MRDRARARAQSLGLRDSAFYARVQVLVDSHAQRPRRGTAPHDAVVSLTPSDDDEVVVLDEYPPPRRTAFSHVTHTVDARW